MPRNPRIPSNNLGDWGIIGEIGEIIGDIAKLENLPTYSRRYGWSRGTPKKGVGQREQKSESGSAILLKINDFG